MRRKSLTAAAILAAFATIPALAWAGPCSDDIAAVGKQLSNTPQLGPSTTGALAGGSAGAIPAHVQTPGPDRAGTTAAANPRMGGTAGTKELDAASSGVATSPADVRNQQLGKPTAAQQAEGGASSTETKPGQPSTATAQDDRVSRAKLAWQQAVDLNARNDQSCKAAVQRARSALNAG